MPEAWSAVLRITLSSCAAALKNGWNAKALSNVGKPERPLRQKMLGISSNRSARRRLGSDAFDLRNRSEARRHGRRSQLCHECVGRDPVAALRHLIDIL